MNPRTREPANPGTLLRIAGVFALMATMSVLPGSTSFAGLPDTPRSAGKRAEKRAKLRVQVSPSVAFAPADVRIQVMVERSDENRGLEFVVESESYYRSSSVELEGAQAAGVHNVEFHALPPGLYEIRVVLTGSGGKGRASEKRQLIVRW
jgi:hypothetical protein